jgi:regulator of cell morphogenesis and NO signaling
LQLPAHACATWTALYRGLETVEAELMQHIHLENNILFSRAVNGAV